MPSLVIVSPVITAVHSCCLSQHVFDQVNLWPTWVGIETAIFWQCSPGTVETQRLYPLGIRLQDSALLSEVAVNHQKKTKGEIWPKRSEEETTQKLPRWGQKVRKKKKKKINSQIKKPHLKIIPIKDEWLMLNCNWCIEKHENT